MIAAMSASSVVFLHLKVESRPGLNYTLRIFESLMACRGYPTCKGARVTRRPASAYQPKSDDRKVMIERVGEPYSRTLHDREAGGIDGGQFVQVGTSEIFPRSLQIAQVAGKDVESARPGYRVFPRQRRIPVGVAIEKGECLNDDRDGSVQLAPAARNRSHCSRACTCTGSRDNARAIHAPPSTKTGSPCRITARRKRYRARSSCVSAHRPR